MEHEPLTSSPHANYQELLHTLDIVASLMTEYFPNTVVVPTFGNNDAKYHYLPAYGSYASPYYADFYLKFFEQHPRNS